MADHSHDQLHAMRHSLAHIMAASIQELWPQTKFGVGPVIENGFYYDVDLGKETIGEDDLAKIEKEMRKLIKADVPFEQFDLDIDEAIKREQEAGQTYKAELLNDLKTKGSTAVEDKSINTETLGVDDPEQAVKTVSYYRNGDFEDLCRGPHAESTGKVGAFKLHKLAGAYWRGDENNAQLQRVYGVAFETQEEVDEYFERLEQAKERDHRKLGQELDLFTFSDLVGSGLPLFTPKGTVLRTKLQRLLEQVGQKYGAEVVAIPHIAKIDLYETSGHAAKFGDELFQVSSHFKDTEFVMKPVNCPHHTQIYASRPRSYRDLPINYMESTMQYRDEKPGELGGLNRVRSITVDDGHLFVTVDQIKEEVIKLAKWIEEFHSSLGLYGNHWVSLSVREPGQQEKYTGTKEDWDKAEVMLAELAGELDLGARRVEGEAAIYGPKLDYMYKDAYGHDRQLSTIQLDFVTPQRFGLTYTDSEDNEQHPVMIHRAILGSYERFLALLIESTAGRFPFWLAPEQIRILTINDTVLDYVDKIKQVLDGTVLMEPLKYNELRYDVDDRNESLGKKIREAEVQKVPVMMIVGPKDKDARQVSLRTQDGEEKVDLDKLGDYLRRL